MRTIIYLLLVLLPLTLTAQKSIKLQLNLQKGDTYRIITTTKNSNSSIANKINHETVTVKELTSTEFLAEIKVDRIQINSSNNGIQISYDSNKVEEQMSTSERGLHSRIKPILSTVVRESINQTAISSNRQKVNGPLNAQIAPQKTNFIKLPKEPITVESQWSQNIKNGKIELTYTYLVTKITSTKVYLESLGIPKGEFKGTVEGMIELDRTTGIPIKKEMNLDLDLSGQVIKTKVTTIIEKV